jgi:hypothetical protein
MSPVVAPSVPAEVTPASDPLPVDGETVVPLVGPSSPARFQSGFSTRQQRGMNALSVTHPIFTASSLLQIDDGTSARRFFR